MSDHPHQSPEDTKALQAVERELEAHLKGQDRRKFARFTLAALGSIPWVGGLISAMAALNAEMDQGRINDLHRQWLDEHKEKISKLGQTIAQIIDRLQGFTEEVQNRFESTEYLALVRKGFRIWDEADTDEKRDLVRLLLTNACATTLCPDDLVRLFLDWIRTYHEAHFKVIREIYRSPGITRGRLWDAISKTRPREDSAEADLYRLLIRDLSAGGVIRQHRETDSLGRFIKKRPGGSSSWDAGVTKSAFDDVDPYELTELGSQFVHYAMNEVVPRIEGQA